RPHPPDPPKRPRLRDRVRIFQQASGVITPALHSISAKLMFTLRGKADVAHHRDARVSYLADLFSHAHPTFELHGLTAALLHEADRGLQGLRRSILIRTERQISDHGGTLGGLHHGTHER